MAEHMAQQNAEGSRDLSTLVDASADGKNPIVWDNDAGGYRPADSMPAIRASASGSASRTQRGNSPRTDLRR